MTQDNTPNALSCATICWAVAALGGLLVAILLMAVAGFGYFSSIFLGALVFIVGALVLKWGYCNEDAVTHSGMSNASSSAKAETASSVDATTSAGIAATPKDAASASTEKAAARAKPDGADHATPAPAPAQSKAKAKPKASAKKKADSPKAPPAKTPAAKAAKSKAKTGSKAASTPPAGIAAIPEQAASPTTEKAAAKANPDGAEHATPAPAPAQAEAKAKPKTPAEKKTAARKATGTPTPAVELADGKGPETLSGPRGGGAGDDLKQLKGVGPGLEKTLNELGFYHFDQIGAWTASDIAWVDSRLRFKGRIERDDWVSQAKTLADGATTEFSSKVKKGGVY